jgi:hypothetical protein
MTELLKKIRSRGYWQIVVRPAEFIEKRIPDIVSLYPILQKTYVSLRGWDFPHLDSHAPPQIYLDSIGQEVDWQHHISTWRFYQSGQFIYITNISIDWRDQSSFWPADDKWKPGTLLGVGDILYRFTEVFEFAARLALSDAGSERVYINVTVGNLKGRALYVDDNQRWPFHRVHKASIEKFPQSFELSRSDLIANPRDIALSAANELFKRFDWHITLDALRDWQNQITR